MGIFKAYDIRGVYPKEINEEIVYRIGKAYVEFLKPKKIAIGRDVRSSSESLFEALVKGITEQGCDVVDIGLSSTPMLYFSVVEYGYDGGIMITASHNPKEYNGLKIVREKSIPINEGDGLEDVEKIYEKNEFKESEKKGQLIKKEILDDYTKFALSFVDLNSIKQLKVVMDGSNGMAGIAAKNIFEKTNIEMIPMYLEPNGEFPNHPPNPMLEEAREEASKKVIENKADFGVMWDGDADRSIFIDNKGKFIDGGFLTGIIADEILKEYPESMIVYDLRASWFVRDIIKKNNGNYKLSRAGHPFFKQIMREFDSPFSGEISGHYFYRYKDTYFEDGIVTALKVIEIVSKKDKSISQLLIPTEKYFVIPETNIKVEDKKGVMKKLEQEFNDGNIYHIDGVSVEYDDWHFNVRPSNTEPLLRLNLEAKTKQKMEEMRDKVLEIIRS
jgi:phosphomannomutase